MKTTLIRSLVTALVLSIGAAGAVVAAPGEMGCGAAGWNPEQRMQRGLKDMSRLHDDLKLDARQDALWQDAEKGMRSHMGEMRDQMRKQRDATLATLNQPGSDLRAAIKQMDETREAARKQHEANRERWLTLYDNLNPEQQEKARQFISQKLMRMQSMEKMRRGQKS